MPIKEFFESSLFGDQFAGNRVKINAEGTLLAAGCYSEWVNKSTGEIVLSFTIITHNPNRKILACGHDRMPIFLNPDQGMEWLRNEGEPLPKLKDFLRSHSINRDLKLDVSIDRPLKDGWQKNAPTEEEIALLRTS